MPVLYTASFYDPQDWMGRVYRVSRAHPRGRKTQWETLPFLYPPRDLLRAYQAGDIGFPDLQRDYLAGLEAGVGLGGELDEWLTTVPSLDQFTLLCFERAGQGCHRRVLAGWIEEKVASVDLGELR
ncbi:MAG: hypothetical protein BZY88_01900 [SAR202 cluster bacterium Io17-Chloro-G9]|nr:MAG: hypothetical protein BZY88_01900 [SAR202 cluster bacterium Io17-Chloro-G9]